MAFNDVPLVDVFLGELNGKPFCEIKGAPGADASLQPLPSEYAEEVEGIRVACENFLKESGRPEFAHVHEGVTYRVTAFDAPGSIRPFLTLSRVAAKMYPIEKLFLPEDIEALLLNKSLRGAVLFVGGMGSGKTSSMQSVGAARLTRLGGAAMAIEDPIETALGGKHGDGLCIQVEVSRHNGGYEEALLKALRSRMGTLFVGEVRDNDTAQRVLSMSTTDHLIFSTMHADSPTSAIQLLHTYASRAGDSDAAGLVSRGLSVVIYQKLIEQRDRAPMLHTEAISLLDPKDSPVIRSMIAKKEFENLPRMFMDQHKRRLRAA
jgi:twitching motility protein PilT